MMHPRPFDAPPEPNDVLGTVKCARWNGRKTPR